MEVIELWDSEAKLYAATHLDRVDVRADGWEVLYVCHDTGARWLQDYPHGEEHGGGPMRLRQWSLRAGRAWKKQDILVPLDGVDSSRCADAASRLSTRTT